MYKYTTIIGLTLVALLLLVACSSEQEKIMAEQKAVCKKQIESGQEPTQFCLERLPQYRAVAAPPLAPQQAYQEAQYAPQQPYYPQQQAPVVVQGAAPQGSGLLENVVSGAAGYALGSMSNRSNNPQPQVVVREVERSGYRPEPRLRPVAPLMNQSPTQAAVAPIAKAPSKFDVGKLSASAAYNPYPAKPGVVVPKVSKPSAMNMGKLGSRR